MIDAIIDALSRGAQWIANLVVKIINGVINFARDIKEWFLSLKLKKGIHIPFIVRPGRIKGLKEELEKATVVDVGIFNNPATLMVGAYDVNEDAITQSRIISGDSLDETTKEIMKDENLVRVG